MHMSSIENNLKQIKDLFYDKIIYDVDNFKMLNDTIDYKYGSYITINDYDSYRFRIDYHRCDHSTLLLYLIYDNKEISLSCYSWIGIYKRARRLRKLTKYLCYKYNKNKFENCINSLNNTSIKHKSLRKLKIEKIK